MVGFCPFAACVTWWWPLHGLLGEHCLSVCPPCGTEPLSQPCWWLAARGDQSQGSSQSLRSWGWQRGGQGGSARRDEGRPDKDSGHCCWDTERLAGLSSKGMPLGVSPLPSPPTPCWNSLWPLQGCGWHLPGSLSPSCWWQSQPLCLVPGSAAAPAPQTIPGSTRPCDFPQAFLQPPLTTGSWGKGRALQNSAPKKAKKSPNVPLARCRGCLCPGRPACPSPLGT